MQKRHGLDASRQATKAGKIRAPVILKFLHSALSECTEKMTVEEHTMSAMMKRAVPVKAYLLMAGWNCQNAERMRNNV